MSAPVASSGATPVTSTCVQSSGASVSVPLVAKHFPCAFHQWMRRLAPFSETPCVRSHALALTVSPGYTSMRPE